MLDRYARVLILGSFPGEASLAARQYYAHPRNHFWPLVGAVLGVSLADLAYGARLATLRRHRVALWDTIVACERRGSLDGAIRNAERGDIARVERVAGDIALVCFNGKTAARAEPVWREAGYATLVLPSSSPANTRPFAEKLAAWRAIGAFVHAEPQAWAMARSIALCNAFAALCVGILCAMALGTEVGAAAPVGPERVRFASFDRDPATGQPVVIEALLFKPEGGDAMRRPAVIALHGCGGMFSAVEGRRDRLSVRHGAMAELLVAEGYVVLLPDSFRSRGHDELCTLAPAGRPIRVANRRLDAQGALAYLQTRADVAPDRIALLGWSHGGSTVLATLNAAQSAVETWTERNAAPYFRAGIAFYPACAAGRQAASAYSLAAPLRMFIAGSDDWTAPQPCFDLSQQLAGAGEPVKITVYGDAHHGFNGPAGRAPEHPDVPGGARPGMGVTVASNPQAKADAYARMKAYLRAWLGTGGLS